MKKIRVYYDTYNIEIDLNTSNMTKDQIANIELQIPTVIIKTIAKYNVDFNNIERINFIRRMV